MGLTEEMIAKIPYGNIGQKGENNTPGKITEGCNCFICPQGKMWTYLDKVFNPGSFYEAQGELYRYATVNEPREKVVPKDPPLSTGFINTADPSYDRNVPPFSLRNYLFLPEELDIMSQRSSTKIIFTGETKITKEDIYKNGGLIPVKSPIRFNISPNKAFTIKSGMKLDIPDGYMGLLLERKSFDTKGIEICGRVIHSTYKDEFEVSLFNKDKNRVVEISIGEEIAQIAIVPIKTNFVLE